MILCCLGIEYLVVATEFWLDEKKCKKMLMLTQFYLKHTLNNEKTQKNYKQHVTKISHGQQQPQKQTNKQTNGKIN